jgi:hypothetical protein
MKMKSDSLAGVVEVEVGSTVRFTLMILLLSLPLASGASQGPDLKVRSSRVYELDAAATTNSLAIVDVVGDMAEGEVEARVAADYGGFDCQVVGVKRFSRQVRRIEIAWQPGSDLSGCKVLITNVQSQKKALVHLYMNF